MVRAMCGVKLVDKKRQRPNADVRPRRNNISAGNR